MGRNASDYSVSPVRVRGSPRRRSPNRRERSPARHKSSRRESSPIREKQSSRAKRETSGSPVPRSPSPRTKRLRRAQSEREAERGHEKNHGKGDDRGSYREREGERENGGGRNDRRSGRDDMDYKSSRSSGRDDMDYKSSRSSTHGHSSSPSGRHHRSRHRSRSPNQAANNRERDEETYSRGDENRNDEDDSITKMKVAEEALAAKQKQEPSFELSGKLAAETNRYRGITLLFNEPPDARKPDVRWRLYVFKGGEVLNEPLYIHRQSCYLFGRERRVADIPTDHPSCSKQHAVIQFRQVEKEQPDGTMAKKVRPYVMDLGSTNKTFINENAIEPQRYYELLEKDTIKFGNSSREYVLLHEQSQD